MGEMHTPGPWSIRGCAGGYMIEGPEGSPRVVKGSGGVGRREDARLIAAAPMLLEAVKDAIDHLCGAVDLTPLQMSCKLWEVYKAAAGDPAAAPAEDAR